VAIPPPDDPGIVRVCGCAEIDPDIEGMVIDA
jgi:hypothetical protein